MKVPRLLRRVCILALLVSAFMLLGEREGVKAQGGGNCDCNGQLAACYGAADDNHDQCMQTAYWQYDACTSSAYAGVEPCQQGCVYDYYWSGGQYDLGSCYNQCSEQMYDELDMCTSSYYSDNASCDTSRYWDQQLCGDEYDFCLSHCP
jgi:hypothetical protein